MARIDNRKVRILGTTDIVTFTPRGGWTENGQRGFIRRNGFTISGTVSDLWREGQLVFEPTGMNQNAAYRTYLG